MGSALGRMETHPGADQDGEDEMSIHNFPAAKKYSDIKILVQDLISDYPDVTKGIIVLDYPDVIEGIIVLLDKEGAVRHYQVCTKSQLAFAAADLLIKSTRDE